MKREAGDGSGDRKLTIALKNFRRWFNNAMDAGLGIILLKLAFGLLIIGVVTDVIPGWVRGLLPA